MPIIFWGLVAFFIASLVAAYNMGWHSGHDIHHDDDKPHHRKNTKQKPPDRSLYV